MTAIAATADTRESAKTKRKHRIANFVQNQGYKLFFAHLGKFMIVAAYFILLQILHGQSTTIFHSSVTLPNVKGTWDSLLSASIYHGGFIHLMDSAQWDSMRHTVFRGVLEGVLGVVLYNQIGFNVEKYRDKLKKKGGAKSFDRLILRSKVFASPYQDHPVTPLQYVFLPVMLFLVTVFVGIPLYLGVHSGLDHAAHWTWLEPTISNHASIWSKIYGGDYDGLIVGLVTGFVAGRTYRAYLYANTMNYGRNWVVKGHKAHWWMPRATRELISDLCEEGVEHQQEKLAERHEAMKVLAPLGVTFAFAMAIFGYFVIQTNGFT